MVFGIFRLISSEITKPLQNENGGGGDDMGTSLEAAGVMPITLLLLFFFTRSERHNSWRNPSSFDR